MAHEDYKEMLSSHALLALDVREARLLEEHLATCHSCRAELDEWHSTASALVFTGSALEPSPQLRERILAQVRSERLGDRSVTAGSPSVQDSGPAKVFPFDVSRKNVWTSIGSLGAIAAAVLFAGLIISVIVLWRENRSAQSELAKLSKQVQSAESQLQTERETVELLTTPGARITELAGTKIAPSAHAMIAYDKNGRAMLLAKGLPATPPGKAYQLWFIVGNQKMPGKTFSIDVSGNGNLHDEIPAVARGAAVFAVTIEPANGVMVPTGEIFLVSGS